MSEFNPWDKTIWDPIDPEHAIEDPLHGPSAVQGMLEIPAMPRGDGTYYQPGAFYALGTAHLDSRGEPAPRIYSSATASRRETDALLEWLGVYQRDGQEGLTELESRRQQQRLEENGRAHCFKPSDVCPGGKLLEACDTGSAIYDVAQAWASNHDQEKPGDGRTANIPAHANDTCTECSLVCEGAVITVDGKPRANRVTFFKPVTGIPVLRVTPLDLRPIDPPEEG